jgi:hypothetical protein
VGDSGSCERVGEDDAGDVVDPDMGSCLELGSVGVRGLSGWCCSGTGGRTAAWAGAGGGTVSLWTTPKSPSSTNSMVSVRTAMRVHRL